MPQHDFPHVHLLEMKFTVHEWEPDFNMYILSCRDCLNFNVSFMKAGPGLFCVLLDSQAIEQCLTHSRHTIIN